MKSLFNTLLLISTLGLAFYSCKKDEVQTVLNMPGNIPSFTSSASSVVLSTANDSASVVNFKWQAPDYGYSSAISYSLWFDVPSDTSGANAWANAVKVSVTNNSTQRAWLGTDLNRMLNQMGLPLGSASTIVVRLKADVNQSTGTVSAVPSLYSVLSMTVTPYKVILIFPKLYVAGDFLTPTWTQKDQGGWILASAKSDSYYEGYVNFPNAGNNFKLCTQPSWNGTNYGWGGTATTLSGSGTAGNCYFGGPGYCKVAADVTALTISYTPTQWRVSGDFNAWSVTATPLVFNTSTNLWTATGVNLTAGGKLKFVGDPNWNTNFGVDAKGNLAYGGGDIIAPKTGSFTITLDLSGGAGNYSYSIK
jgi:hypothetical protein